MIKATRRTAKLISIIAYVGALVGLSMSSIMQQKKKMLLSQIMLHIIRRHIVPQVL